MSFDTPCSVFPPLSGLFEVYGWQALRLQKKPKARTGSGFCHVGELDEGPREEWAPPAEEPVWESVAAAEKD